jgi:acyl-CoA thioester hydrolase|tara:strand:- start:9227 stop:9646 length:420 start_codon:yes stop_codon:yes gene_type:complete
MKKVSLDIDIPFFDVDAYRVVWHGNYPKYIEMSRCALLSEIGCPYSVMEEHGFFFPIVDIQVKYVKPLVFEQKVVIESWLTEWENRLKISYVIKDKASGEIYTKAKTTQFAVAMPDQITQFESPPFLVETINAWLNKHD